MTLTDTLAQDATIAQAYVAIDCVGLGCMESVEYRTSMAEVEIVCDRNKGVTKILRHSPTGEIIITPIDLSMQNLAFALDASVSTTTGDITVGSEAHTPTWVPDVVGTPTVWTAVLILANSEIATGTVLAWDDAAASVSWDSESENSIAETSLCPGTITLTTTEADERLTTIYMSYDYGTEIPSGSEVIKPSYAAFSNVRKITIASENSSTGKLLVVKTWKGQIIPDFTVRWSNEARLTTAPIRIRILEDSTNHPDAPLSEWYNVVASKTDYDFEPYTSIPGNT